MSTLVLVLIICLIIGTNIVMRRKKLRKNQIKIESKNVYDIVLEGDYDDINNEYDRNDYMRMNFYLNNYEEIGVY